ncbi:MAG TPA: DUF6089 family protein [Chryseosolibacter sp.]
MRYRLLFCILFFAVIAADAQSFYSVRRDRTLIFSAGSGTSTYFGELANPGDYFDARPNINIGLSYFVAPQISVRAEATWFQLAGSDAKAGDPTRTPRNLSFVSDNYEIGLTGALHLFPLGNRYYQRPVFNAYGFAGLAVMRFNPRAELNGTKYPLQPLMTEGVKYSRTQLVIPYGLGVRLKAGPFFNLAIEGGYRLTFTDYLDDVSTVHPDKSTWTDPLRIALSDRSGELNNGVSRFEPGRIRGNPEKNDGYFLLNIKVEYYLPTNFLFKNQSKLYRSKRKVYYRRPRRR